MSGPVVRSVADTDLFAGDGPLGRLLVRTWRALASGRPLDAARFRVLARAEQVPIEHAMQALEPVLERDRHGRVVGALGLSLADHPHGFQVDGRQFQCWCAVDTLFLPGMLGRVARVTSRCPVTGTAVTLSVAPDGVRGLQPAAAVVSVPELASGELDTGSAAGIRATFCQRIHYFADAGAAARWLADSRQRARVLPVADAHEHAQQRWATLLAAARELDALKQP